ncbi:MAG: hypothetical protein N2578_07705, partial [Bdellovibrionaceae bacterium]|nr:hypothetical protein [Pseudobdellovibrionaceae bacterium]
MLNLSVLVAAIFLSSYSEGKNLPLNNLRFTNRAQCAIDSHSPTASVFLIIDGFNAGRLGHGLALQTGGRPDEMAERAMLEFRLSTTRLVELIAGKLIRGELPLLPLDPDARQFPNYFRVVQNCKGKSYCAELSSYLTSIWQLAGAGVKPGDPRWSRIDGFTNNSFLNRSVVQSVSCFYLKRFSPLQGHLHYTEVSTVMLEELARAVMESDKLLARCDDSSPELPNRFAALQFDISVSEDNASIWETRGFRFWNSLKVYLSWAWRFTNSDGWGPSNEWREVFRSLALEESIMFFPNGCKTMSRPECNAEELALASLRDLAKPEPGTEHRKSVPSEPEDLLLERGARGVNNDFTGTRGEETAAKWVERFRRQYVMNRGLSKTRLQNAVQYLNVVMDMVSPEVLVSGIQQFLPLASREAAPANELYYLCTEVRLAGDKRLDFLKSDVDNVAQLDSMIKSTSFSRRPLGELFDYFDRVAALTLNVCDQLERTNLWQRGGYTPDKTGFMSWAKEVLQIPQVDENGKLVTHNPFRLGPSYLVWDQSAQDEAGNTICVTPVDCIRNIVKSAVDLYAVSLYAEAFLPTSSTSLDSNIFNPYAELTACKVYDPWFQKNRIQKRLVADLLNTALFGWNFLPIYVEADFRPPRVTSLQRLTKNGTIKFHPSLDRSRMEATIIADFGPLAAAPCAVAIAPTSARAFTAYAFKGISVNYCDSRQSGQAIGESVNDIRYTPAKSRSYCGGCSLNFEAVAGTMAST